MREHAPDCPLATYTMHWLRHAVAAAGYLVAEEPNPREEMADRVSAERLTDSLARFAEQDDWETITLRDVAKDAELETPHFQHQCTCGAFDHPE